MSLIQEHSKVRICWDACILFLVVISILIVPFQIGFHHQFNSFDLAVIYAVDLFFIADIILNFFTSYRYQGIEIRDAKRTAQHYLKTLFPVDLAANLPIDLLFLAEPENQALMVPIVLLLRLPRLLRIVKLMVIFRRWEGHGWINPGIIRIVKFIITIGLIIHGLCCLWFLSAAAAGFPDQCWVVREGIKASSLPTQYLRSLYWTITTMTTVGYGDITPVLNSEYILSIIVMLVGASIYAFMIGTIASLFSNLDAEKSSLFTKIESLTRYLKARKIPNDTVQALRNYYEYQWENHKGGNEDVLFNDLPDQFRLRILRHLIGKSLNRVPLFQLCTPALRDELLKDLTSDTYPPGITIAREGEIGRDLFF